jgi:dihydroflavonol-4-reductase
LILVTGGGGFIGSHLVNQLVEAGEAVRVLEKPGADVGHLPPDAIQLARGDIRHAQEVRDAVRDCRQVYHLAANPNLWTRVRSDFDAVNNEGTRNVLREALRAGAERILHTSEESILARAQSNGQSVEKLRLTDENMIDPYCLSKLTESRAMKVQAYSKVATHSLQEQIVVLVVQLRLPLHERERMWPSLIYPKRRTRRRLNDS